MLDLLKGQFRQVEPAIGKFERLAVLPHHLVLVGPLAEFLRRLLLVLAHLLEQAGIDRVVGDNLTVLPSADRAVLTDQQARRAARHPLHLRVRAPLVDDLLQRLPALVERSHAPLAPGDGTASRNVSQRLNQKGATSGEFRMRLPARQLPPGHANPDGDLLVRKVVLGQQRGRFLLLLRPFKGCDIL